jgi:beta-glucosidase
MPFQAVIHKAGVASVMNAYPELNGQVVAASRDILTHLLRNALHFDGLIVSDYQAISMLHHYHNAAPDYTTAAAMALMAGIEVELPTRCCYGEHLKIALEKGLVTLDQVDEAVRRHLQKKYELGLFENPLLMKAELLRYLKHVLSGL